MRLLSLLFVFWQIPLNSNPTNFLENLEALWFVGFGICVHWGYL